jgi:hypothetical protein
MRGPWSVGVEKAAKNKQQKIKQQKIIDKLYFMSYF